MTLKKFTPISVSGKIYKNNHPSRCRHPFNDLRSTKVWEKTINLMAKKKSTAVQCLAKDQGEADQIYRFMNNDNVEVEELIKMNCQVNPESIMDKGVFVIGDSSSIYLGRSGRIKDLEKVGVLTGGKKAGFHMHVNIAMNEQCDILGLSDIMYWSRAAKEQLKEGEKAPVDTRDSKDKESYKWSLGAENSKKVLAWASQRTYIFDQEADQFELQAFLIRDLQDDFIIRANHNRKVEYKGELMRVDQCMERSKSLGVYQTKLRPLDHYSRTFGKRIIRKAREATIEVRSERVNLQAPGRGKNKDSLPLYLVEAREITEGLPKGEEPILWRIWTTHPVETFEQAKQIIKYYSKRWIVEQFFRTLKQKGLKIEQTQFETFEAILRQTTLAMNAAVKILQLVYARNREDCQPTNDVFDEKEQKILQKINTKLEGNTEKQKNPFHPEKLSWASWIIARLGGWKGYASQRPPGPITMMRGLQKLGAFVEAYNFFDSN